MDAITIPIQVHPDVVLERDNVEYSSARKMRYSYIISHSIIVIQELDKNGDPVTYSSSRYVACRLQNGKIEYLDNKYGWLVDEDATKEYFSKQAEKELLT